MLAYSIRLWRTQAPDTRTHAPYHDTSLNSNIQHTIAAHPKHTILQCTPCWQWPTLTIAEYDPLVSELSTGHHIRVTSITGVTPDHTVIGPEDYTVVRCYKERVSYRGYCSNSRGYAGSLAITPEGCTEQVLYRVSMN